MHKKGYVMNCISSYVVQSGLRAFLFLLLSVGPAASGQSPTKALVDRDAYYPGTEDLASNEMRVTACGTEEF